MHKGGFTLIEILVVVGIVALVAATILANLPNFKGMTALQQEEGNMSFAFRKAEQYAIAVRRFDTTFSSPQGSCTQLYQSQFPAYGISFTIAQPTQYGLYADPNCTRGAAIPQNQIESYTLSNGIFIKDICVDIDNVSPSCNKSGIDVWYVRPGPAIFFNVTPLDGLTHQSAKIILSLPTGAKKSVVVRASGQVSFQDEP